MATSQNGSGASNDTGATKVAGGKAEIVRRRGASRIHILDSRDLIPLQGELGLDETWPKRKHLRVVPREKN